MCRLPSASCAVDSNPLSPALDKVLRDCLSGDPLWQSPTSKEANYSSGHAWVSGIGSYRALFGRNPPAWVATLPKIEQSFWARASVRLGIADRPSPEAWRDRPRRVVPARVQELSDEASAILVQEIAKVRADGAGR